MAEDFLQASGRGDGCGVAVVGIAAGKQQIRLCVTVLPKVWASASAPELVTTIDLSALETGQVNRLNVVVYETQRVRLTGAEKTVETVGDALTGLKFDPGDAATEKKPARLFERAARCQSKPRDSEAEQDRQVRAFWTMMSHVKFSGLITPPRGVADSASAETYIAEKLLPNVTALEPLVQQEFLRLAEKFVRRRRPEFRHHIDDMSAVRGRIVTSGLVRRAARGQQAVACEFDELDADVPWQQVIRFAAGMVSRHNGHSNDRLAGRAARVARILADCHSLHPRVARQMCSSGALKAPRKARFAAETLELARWLILARYPFGVQEDCTSRPQAVAAGVRVPTSRLWERLLAGVKVEHIGTLEQHSETVRIRQKAGMEKSPDLCVRSEGGDVIAWFDAKYKMRRPRFEAMPMADQYQQYAYAAATGKPTVFVYVSDSEHPGKLSEDVILVNGSPGPGVGVATVPFPRPEDCDDITVWRRRVGERLRFTTEFSRATWRR